MSAKASIHTWADLLQPRLRQISRCCNCPTCYQIPFVNCFGKSDKDCVLVRIDCHGETTVVEIPRRLIENDQYKEIERLVMEDLPI